MEYLQAGARMSDEIFAAFEALKPSIAALKGNTAPVASAFPIAVTVFAIFCFEGRGPDQGALSSVGALGAVTVRLFFGTVFLWAMWPSMAPAH